MTTWNPTWQPSGNNSLYYGYWVYVDHGLYGSGPNHLYSIYAHLGSDGGSYINPFAVANGTVVSQAATIGYSGYTGSVIPTGPGGAHLHFTVHVSSVANAPWGDGTQGTALNAEPLSGNVHFERWGLHGSPPATSSNCASGPGVDSGTLTSTTPPPACTSVTESAAPTSPQNAGTPVVFSGSASGCTNPQYEFWALWAGTSTWQLLQGYSTNATYNWNSTGAGPGIDTFGVWACSGTCPSPTYDVFTSIPYTINGTCTSETGNARPFSPQPAGTAIVITGAASGCPNPLYEFWARWAGTTNWVMLQAYSIYPTYTWDSSGALPGTEYFGVWARDASSFPVAGYDVYISIPFTIT